MRQALEYRAISSCINNVPQQQRDKHPSAVARYTGRLSLIQDLSIYRRSTIAVAAALVVGNLVIGTVQEVARSCDCCWCGSPTRHSIRLLVESSPFGEQPIPGVASLYRRRRSGFVAEDT